jgi:hypothetical protein
MQIKSIDALSLKIRLDQASVILIDVREPHEHTREHLEGARLVPLSRFQAEDFGAFVTRSPCSIVTAAVVPARISASSCRTAFATPIT